MPTLWIDADACPVRAEAVAAGLRHRWRVRLVCNGGIRPSAHPGAELVIVPEGPDMADRVIAEGCEAGDVAVTADIPLAARVIAAGGRVVRPDGMALGPGNIGPALAARDLAADLRAADPFRQGRSRAFGAAERRRFLDALERALRGL